MSCGTISDKKAALRAAEHAEVEQLKAECFRKLEVLLEQHKAEFVSKLEALLDKYDAEFARLRSVEAAEPLREVPAEPVRDAPPLFRRKPPVQ